MLHAEEDRLYGELVQLLKKKLPNVNLDRIQRAFDFAMEAHAGQFRASGESYVCHPLETAKTLAKLQSDEDTIIAGLLHDVPEDTAFTVADLDKRFGRTVGRLVQAVTKLSKVHYQHSMDQRQVDSLRSMFLETANDVRVVIIKLADRLHNMRTIRYLRPDKQQRIAKETLEIFAPLANLYGIFQVRRELEDLCFQVLQPEEYARIDSFVSENEKKRTYFVRDSITILKKNLQKSGVKVEIEGRPKHYYSIYQKMVKYRKDLSDIYDYFAIRIVVSDREDCYHTLGVVHETFRPKPGRFKDYIAFPKPNGYQSLHTTVVGLEGKLTEIQIRTTEMHREAELGAAAHVLYKNGKGGFVSESIERLRHYKHPESFIRSLQEDVLQHRIYVFSSHGEIVNLPVGASCLDFVFATDTPVNKKALRPLVNNKPYSLFGELQSGDHVQILDGNREQKGPERGWLEHVKTTKAKEKIQDHFRKQSLNTKVGLGMNLLQQQMDHENQGLIRYIREEKKAAAAKSFRLENFGEVLASIGEGTLDARDVYQILFPELQLGSFMQARHWLHALKRRFNFGAQDYKYRIRIAVEAYDRVGLLKEIIQPFYELKLPIIWIQGNGHDVRRDSAFLSDGQPATPELISRDLIDVYVEDHEELIALFDRLEKIPGVIRVQRMFRQRTASFVFLALVIGAYFAWHPFAIRYLTQTNFPHKDLLTHVIIYTGLTGLFALMVWLRTMGNKTFPHFEETKTFWPLAFGLTFLAVGTVFVDNIYFNLHLNVFATFGVSLLILLFVFTSYRKHEEQRSRHLNRLSRPSQNS